MGSLTQSLLASSADKRAQDADTLKESQDVPAKTAKAAASGTQNPGPVQKAENKIGSAVKKVTAPVDKVLGSFKEGGTVPKTGMYKLHEGEEVVPAGRASEYRKVYLGRKSKKD